VLGLLAWIVPFLLVIGFFVWMSRRSRQFTGRVGGIMAIGKSKARVYEDRPGARASRTSRAMRALTSPAKRPLEPPRLRTIEGAPPRVDWKALNEGKAALFHVATATFQLIR
jgi:hypothetical protein